MLNSDPGTRSSGLASSPSYIPRGAPTRATSRAGFDNSDGQRPGPRIDLETLSDTTAADAWATWPGMWGGTQPPPDDLNPLDDSSPRGPGGHVQYQQPDALVQTAIAHQASLAPPPPAAAPP